MAQLALETQQQTRTDSAEPVLAAGGSEVQSADPGEASAPVETPVVVENGSDESDSDAAGSIRLVDADESIKASDLQTQIVDARAEAPAIEQPADTESAGFGATLQRALGDRNTLLGAGAGLALLGLLGAWLFRRKPKAKTAAGTRVEPDFTPREPQMAETNSQSRTTVDAAAATAATAIRSTAG